MDSAKIIKMSNYEICKNYPFLARNDQEAEEIRKIAQKNVDIIKAAIEKSHRPVPGYSCDDG